MHSRAITNLVSEAGYDVRVGIVENESKDRWIRMGSSGYRLTRLVSESYHSMVKE